MSEYDHDFSGLNLLMVENFPKKCSTCGKVYNSSEEYLRETLSLGKMSGFKESYDDDDNRIVELYRNCSCGSTLMGLYQCRRDESSGGAGGGPGSTTY